MQTIQSLVFLPTNSEHETVVDALVARKMATKTTVPLESRVRCHCLGAFGQRCIACDPNGTLYGPVRPELAVRIDG